MKLDLYTSTVHTLLANEMFTISKFYKANYYKNLVKLKVVKCSVIFSASP